MDILQTGNASKENACIMNCRQSALSLSEAPTSPQKDGEMSNLLRSHPPDVETTDVQVEVEDVSQPEVTPTKEVVVFVVQPDGGWGWVVCLSCAVCMGVMFGILNSFGILYVLIREKYGEDGLDDISFKAAWVGSVCICFTFLLGAVAGVISDVIGIRKTGLIGGVVALVGILSSTFVENVMLLYLTFGLLIGVGFSLILGQCFVILGHYFKRHLGLANGIVHLGSSVFTVALSLILPESIDALGLQKTFLVLSGLVVLLIPCTLTWKAILPIRSKQAAAMERHSSGKTTKSKARLSFCCRLPKLINTDLFRNKSFVSWMLAIAISATGFYVPLVHLVKFIEDEFPDHRGNLAILFFSGGGAFSRLVIGRLADVHWVRRLSIQLMSLAILGTCTVCIPFCQTYWGLVTVVILLGAGNGASTCLIGPVAFELVGEANASQALGFLLASVSIPQTAGPPLAGLLYDHLGNYKLAFHLAGCFPLIGAFVMLFIRQPETTNIAP